MTMPADIFQVPVNGIGNYFRLDLRMIFRYSILQSRTLQQLHILQIRSSHPVLRLVEAYSRSGHCSERSGNITQLFLSCTIGFTTGQLWQIQFSRLKAQDRPRGVRDVETGETSRETVSNMITESTTMTVVECPHLPRGVDHMCPGDMMTDAHPVASEEYQSTQESQALMRDLFVFKVWSTGTKRTGRALTGIARLVAEFMFQVQSVLAEPSEPQ